MNLPLNFPGSAMEVLRDNSERAASLLKSLANPDRLLLLCQLVEGERSVTELEALTGIRQPTLSQQLGVLRNEGNWWPPGVTANGCTTGLPAKTRWRFWARCTRFTAPDLNRRAACSGGEPY